MSIHRVVLGPRLTAEALISFLDPIDQLRTTLETFATTKEQY
jgi:hypothetical protein